MDSFIILNFIDMKKIVLLGIYLLSLVSYGQKSSEILPVLNVDSGIMPSNFVFIIDGTNYWGKTSASNLFFSISQITNLQTNLDAKYPLSGNPSNFIIGNGLSSEYINGLGNKVTFPTFGPVLSAGGGISLASNIITNTAPDQTVTLTGGNRISITGTYPNFNIGFIEPTINIITSKTLNSNYTISATKQAFVSYSLTCSVTNPLLAGSSTATVFLEYSINGGSTWLLPSQNGNLSSVALAVAVAITNGQTVTVAGSIPGNALVRLRTATTGTASVTYITGT